MASKFVNIPVPLSNTSGAAVDASGMGLTKTFVMGGTFRGYINIEYATDEAGTDWAPLCSFGSAGYQTVQAAARWLRASMTDYSSGTANCDVGSNGVGASFVQIPSAPFGGGTGAQVSIADMPLYKNIVTGDVSGSPARPTDQLIIEFSLDGTSWAQVMTFQAAGAKGVLQYAQFARCVWTGSGTAPSVYLGAASDTADSATPAEFTAPAVERVIYARATGSDTAGDGTSIATAYRTVQRAALDVPLTIPGGVYYTINATDLIEGGAEILPANYALPPWRSSVGLVGLEEGQSARGAVELYAELRDVPALGADAIVASDDLETTDVGGPIVSASNATPILVTTTTPHGLVESPFGVFGVFAGLVQVVEIAGVVGNDAANGVFLALVTRPTVEVSTTFELYDFDFNPVAGIGAGVGGTVTILYVQDRLSGQVQVKLSAPRASWIADGPDTLKGKILTNGAEFNAVVYANTDDTLYLASNGSPPFGFDELRITEPSCALQCVETQSVEHDGARYVGGLNIVNVDSMSMSGIHILAAPDGTSMFQGGGVLWAKKCVLEVPTFALRATSFMESSHLLFPNYNTVPVDLNRCLVDNLGGGFAGYMAAFHGSVIIQEESPLPSDSGVGLDGTIDFVAGVKVISAADPVFFIEGGGGLRLWGVSIEGGAGDAFVIKAQGDHEFRNVGGSGWAGTALVVDNGVQVEVNVFSFLKTDEMLVGELAARTFEDFRINAPLRQQFDVTYDPTAGAPAQATGTASRVFQS